MPVQDTQPNKRRSLDEIYASVVERIKKQYHYKISDQEADEAARNLLGFCQKLVEIKAEQIRDKS